MLLFFSLLPFAVFILLLLWKKWPLLWVSSITMVLMMGLSIFYWRILPAYFANSLIKGVLVASDIFVIVAGAIFFLEILTKTKIIDHISYYLESFSKDYRIQVILMAWFFENFIEGTAGFGTPSALVAPILISLGIQPFVSVVIALLGNSASVVFGAAGTPIRVGLAGLEIGNTAFYSAAFNCVGFLVPIFILWVLVSGKSDRKQQFFEALPFAIWSGIVFVTVSFATVFIGQEFPSIIGSLVSLLIIFITTRLRIFTPKVVRKIKVVKDRVNTVSFLEALAPYVALIFFLVVGKFFLGSVVFKLFDGVTQTYNLFNPGWAFLLVAIPIGFVWQSRNSKKGLVSASFKTALKRTVEPFLVIAFTSAVVQLMIYSGENSSGIPSLLNFLARGITSFLLPFWAPFVGAFGSFITGSATVSNIMFGDLLQVTSQSIGLDSAKILALALVGAAAGNMIALADILATTTVVGLKNEEHRVVKRVLPFCAIYVLAVGLIGLLVV
jgi:lactate permease